MSNYRDDTQETAVASSSTWLGLTAITEEVARTASILLFGLLVVHSCTATATDEVIDSWSHLTPEVATISDEVVDSLQAAQLVAERATAGDRVIEALTVWHEDSASATDSVIDAMAGMVTETAAISDEVLGQRLVQSLVVEQARATDKTMQAASVLVEDAATASDAVTQRARMAVVIADQAMLSDEVVDGHGAAPEVARDAARITGEIIDKLQAADLVVDAAVIEDAVIQSGIDAGQAWTANADTWAMSRYAPYTFESLAVIDGVLYGVNEQGVFALDGQADPVAASIKTGKLDLGGKALVHPVSAYLEYALDGIAELDVTTTQTGAAQTYTYGLPNELADELTNGRFVFGRGLRGRHFAFTLRMTGTHGHINDLSVMTAPTKRRV